MSRSVWVVLLATFVTNIGNGLHTLAVGKLLYDVTGSAIAFGGIVVLQHTATFLFQALAGPWVDRGSPKWTCVLVDLARGVVVCVAAAWIVPGNAASWTIAATLAIQVGRPFYRSAMFALAPLVAQPESLTKFNAHQGGWMQAGLLVGVLCAGPVLQKCGTSVALGLNGVSFVVAALLVACARAQSGERKPPANRNVAGVFASILADWRELGGYVRRNPGLGWHIAVSSVDYVSIAILNVVIVPLVMGRFGGNVYGLSICDGSFAVGALAGAWCVDRVAELLGKRQSVMCGILGQGTCFIVLAMTRSKGMTAGVIVLLGVANSLSWAVLLSTLQLRSGRMRGRVASAREFVTAALVAVVVPVVAGLQVRSVSASLIAGAALCVVFLGVVSVIGGPRVLGSSMFEGSVDGDPV